MATANCPIILMVGYSAGGAREFQAHVVTMTAGNKDALGAYSIPHFMAHLDHG